MPFFIAAVAFLFAATFLYPGDAMIQVGGGHFLTVLWLLLLLLRLSGYGRHAAGTQTSPSSATATARESSGKKTRRDRTGRRKSRAPSVEQAAGRNTKTDRDPVPLPPMTWTVADALLGLFLLVYLVFSPLIAAGTASDTTGSGFFAGGNVFAASNIFSAWIAAACAWLLFRQILAVGRTAGLFLLILAALGLTQSFAAFWQHAVVLPRQAAVYRADPAGTLRQAGFDFAPDSTEGRLLASRIETATPTGSYILTNTLGGQLATVALVVALPLLCLLPTLSPRSFRRRDDQADGDAQDAGAESRQAPPSGRFPLSRRLCATLAILLPVFYALFLTRCRSAFVALAVGFVVALGVLVCRSEGFRFRHFRHFGLALFLGLLPLLLATAFALSPPGRGLLQGAKRSLGFRLEYWTSTAEMIADHPGTGCGIGNFQQSYLRYKKPEASEEILDPHNFVMELAGCGGLPSVTLFLLFLAALFRRPWKSRPPEPAATPSRFRLSPVNEARVYWAALAGCLVATGLSWTEGGNLPVELFVAAPAAFALVWFMYKIFAASRDTTPAPLPAFCFGVPLLGLLVHLLAAGGISYINVLVLLMFLAAATLARSQTIPETTADGSQETTPPPRDPSFVRFRIGTPCLGTVCAVLLLGVLFGLYLPGLRAGAALEAASAPGETSDERVRLLEQGARNSPALSHEYQRALLEARFRAWVEHPDRRHRESLETEIERIATRSARAPLILLSLAGALERIETVEPDPGRRETILRYYDRACVLYPNHAKVRAPYALALWKYGRRDEALLQRDAALRLDDRMPHLEQHLPQALRNELENLPKTPARDL